MIDSNVTTAGGNRQEENHNHNGFSVKLLSTREAADFLGVTIRTLKNWKKTGSLVPAADVLRGNRRDNLYSLEQLSQFREILHKTMTDYDTIPECHSADYDTQSTFHSADYDTQSTFHSADYETQSTFHSADYETTPTKGDTMSLAKGDTQNLQSEKTVCMEVNLCKRQTPLSHTQEATPMKKQTLENLPDEILSQSRFFPVYANKNPATKAWSRRENQQLYTQATQKTGLAGFDTCGHERGDDYLLIDFDHVLDDDGKFISSEAERWFNYIQQSFDSYCERSISGNGIHILARPTPGKFKKIINTLGKGVIPFADSPVKGSKLELFYRQAARYCFLTGELFNTQNKSIASGEVVDEVLTQLLRFAETFATKKTPARQSASDTDRKGELPTGIRELVNQINSITDEQLTAKGYLQHSVNGAPAPLGYICPWCLSGTHKHKTGALQFYTEPNNNHVHCHAQQCHGDIIALLAKIYDMQTDGKDFFALIRRAADDFAVTYDPKIFDYSPTALGVSRFQIGKPNDAPQLRKAASLASLESLSTEPQSADRDRKLISAIKDCLDWGGSKNARYIKPTYKNLRLIFDYDPALRGLFGFDEFAGVTVFLRKPPWKRTTNYRLQWTDDDDAQLRLYLRRNYDDLACRQLTDDLSAEIRAQNSFNAVKEFFYNLPEWDGVKRAENLFIKFLRVDDTAYTREVTLNWLTGAVARIINPGCRYHTALVLHGAQKIGKSYIIERLGGKWYGAVSDDVSDSHAIDAIQNLWIAEFKELAAMRKTDVNKIKEFVEIAVDNRREAYARRAKMTPRHCVFAITVNDDEFLRDVTGNRRFLILHSKSRKFEYVTGLDDQYIRQIWAEVYAHYKDLFADGFDDSLLQLSKDAEKQGEEIADQYLQDDGLTTEIKSYLDEKILPQVIWQLLSREERRQFFARKELQLFDGRRALEQRISARYQGDVTKINQAREQLNKVLQNAACTRCTENNGNRTYYFVGTEYRQHICALEIYIECFGAGDKRKKMFRINEILSQLDDWELRGNGRLQKADPAYADQKKAFWRITQPADATPAQTDDPLQGVIVDTEDVPF